MPGQAAGGVVGDVAPREPDAGLAVDVGVEAAPTAGGAELGWWLAVALPEPQAAVLMHRAAQVKAGDPSRMMPDRGMVPRKERRMLLVTLQAKPRL